MTTGPEGGCSPTKIAERLDGTPITALLRTVTEGSQSLAEIYQQLPHEMHTATGYAPRPSWRLPAGTTSQRRRQVDDVPRYRDTTDQTRTSSVTPTDVGTNRLHRLTPTALNQMRHTAAALAGAADTALDAVLVNIAQPVCPGAAGPPTSGDNPAVDLSAGDIISRPRPRLATEPARPPHPQHRTHPGPDVTP